MRIVNAILLAAVIAVAQANAKGQDLSWPADFGTPAPASAAWIAHQVDAGALRIGVTLPAQWTVRPVGSDPDYVFTALSTTDFMRVDIEPLSASGFALETPLPNETLKGSIATVQANVASRGHEIIAAGQVRAGNRLWVWHESRMRSAAFEQGPIGSGRAWIFTGTPAKQRMTIYCTVMYERGASPEVIAAKTRRAGAVFAGMLERLSVDSGSRSFAP